MTLFALLADKFPTSAAIAAALGISRQAYSQATKRHRLSDSAILRAAKLLKIDPAPLFVERAQLATVEPQNPPAPVPPPAPEPANDADVCRSQYLYYVKLRHHQGGSRSIADTSDERS